MLAEIDFGKATFAQESDEAIVAELLSCAVRYVWRSLRVRLDRKFGMAGQSIANCMGLDGGIVEHEGMGVK